MIQVIRWLTMGLASQTKAEKRFCEETPLERPTDDEKLRLAIMFLEAADRVNRDDLLKWHSDRTESWWAEDDEFEQIKGLLSAIPTSDIR